MKLGAETEDYDQTTMWGYNVMDTYHRVSRIEFESSKWWFEVYAWFGGIERNNRVYIDGGQLGKIWKENKEFYYNSTSGQWYSLDGVKPNLKKLMKK